MVFNKCCCCIELRVGAIIIAVLEIIEALGCLRYGIHLISLRYYYIVTAILRLVSGGCLLYGAIKYHQIMTIMNLVFSMTGIVFCVVVGVYIFASLPFYINPDKGAILNSTAEQEAVTGVGWIIGALVTLYFWLCVFSLLKALKSGTVTAQSRQVHPLKAATVTDQPEACPA